MSEELDLVEIIQSCLESHLERKFESEAQLTYSISREVVEAVVARSKSLTDEKLKELSLEIKETIASDAKLIEFMNEIKSLLGGDDYNQVVGLINDTAFVTNALQESQQEILAINQTLADMAGVQLDHRGRIVALEPYTTGLP